MAVRMTGTAARAVPILSLLAILPIAPACQILAGYESFERGDGAVAVPHRCDVLPATKIDDKGLGTLVLSKEFDGNCYWIDKTEVTVEQYSRFIAEHPDPVAWDTERCGWKSAPSDPKNDPTHPCTATSLSLESDPFAAKKPIRCVDWCDAKAFCNWAGKDLCGGNTNGSMVGPVDVHPQWDYACSKNAWNFPYGSKPIDRACNVGLSNAECYSILHQNQCAPTDVDSFSRCTSPSGAVDMVGNVAEWVLSCSLSSDAGPSTQCQYRGGSFADGLDEKTCYTVGYQASMTRDRTIGLRCCANLTVSETHQLPTSR